MWELIEAIYIYIYISFSRHDNILPFLCYRGQKTKVPTFRLIRL